MDQFNNNAVERELGWEDAIQNDSPEFVLLPEGEYDFVVDRFERGRHNGSDKLPPCNKVEVFLKIDTPQGTATVRHNLFLHTRTEGMICNFFTAIGQRKRGERYTMNWNAVPGARGRARIGIREYNGKKYNEVKRFLEPAAPAVTSYSPAVQPGTLPGAPYPQQTFQAPAPAAGGWQPGKF